MKKEMILFMFSMLFLVSGVLGATCTYMGEEIPCDEMPTWVWVMPILIFGFLFVFVCFILKYIVSWNIKNLSIIIIEELYK